MIFELGSEGFKFILKSCRDKRNSHEWAKWRRPYRSFLPFSTEVCNMDGQTYQVGQKFANKDCTMYCTCRPGGNLGCTSMCPPTAEPMCSFDSHVLIKEFSGADPSGRCKCRRTVCEKRKPGGYPTARNTGHGFNSWWTTQPQWLLLWTVVQGQVIESIL